MTTVKKLISAALLLGALAAAPAEAQIQYFGYVGGADDDWSLGQTRGFSNFAQISTEKDLAGTFIRSRINSMSPYGIKAVIDLGLVFWCDYYNNQQYVLCNDYNQRFATWKQNNADVLTATKVLAFSVRDEPFRNDVDMAQYEMLSQMVRTAFPWAKQYLVDSPCALVSSCPSSPLHPTAYTNYHGSLPNVDWIGIDDYAIYPGYDSTFLNTRTAFKARFPGKKWLYIADGFWDGSHVQAFGGGPSAIMGSIAQQWYDVARADPDAVLLGVFGWSRVAGLTMSTDFACDALTQPVAIGRAITGKTRTQTAAPLGFFYGIDSNGIATGWACDPDGMLCDRPVLDYYVNGIYGGHVPYSTTRSFNGQCGTTRLAYSFQGVLPGTMGAPVTIYAHDLDGGSTPLLPSNCSSSGCVWYTNYYQPKGYMEAISPTGIVAGWVCDPDAPLVSSKVRIAVASTGASVATLTTNLGNEQAVSDECGGGTLHRFSFQLSTSALYVPLVAYSEDLMGGEVQIPWLCGDGWTCGWAT